VPRDNRYWRRRKPRRPHFDARNSDRPSEHHELLRHAANAIHAVNSLAHNYKQIPHASKRLYASKHELLSLMLEMDVLGVKPAWQEQDNHDHLLTISIGDLRTPHCPFRGLSWSAQCKVVQRIGPAPKSMALP